MTLDDDIFKATSGAQSLSCFWKAPASTDENVLPFIWCTVNISDPASKKWGLRIKKRQYAGPTSLLRAAHHSRATRVPLIARCTVYNNPIVLPIARITGSSSAEERQHFLNPQRLPSISVRCVRQNTSIKLDMSANLPLSNRGEARDVRVWQPGFKG